MLTLLSQLSLLTLLTPLQSKRAISFYAFTLNMCVYYIYLWASEASIKGDDCYEY